MRCGRTAHRAGHRLPAPDVRHRVLRPEPRLTPPTPAATVALTTVDGLLRNGRPPREWVWHVDGAPVGQATARPVLAGMSRHDAVMLEFTRRREE